MTQSTLHLGHSAIDVSHDEFTRLVAALAEADDAATAPRFERLALHLREHFGDEDRLMRETGFPSQQCHLDEHAAVLASVEDVRRALQQGRPETARRLAHALTGWFPEHVDAMDRGLATWAFRQRTGGAPMVLQRTAPRTAAQEA